MQPWLIYTDTFVLPTYFTMLVLAACTAPAAISRECRRDGVSAREALDLTLIAFPAVLVGARIGHVLVEPTGAYWRDPSLWFSLQSGTAVWGALVAGAITLWSYARHRGIDPWALADRCAPATFLAMAIGRLGCLAGGCCHGRPADWPFGWTIGWSVTLHHRSVVSPDLLAVPIHPWPLYDAFFCLAIFVWISRKRSTQRYYGQSALAAIGVWGVGRALLEVARGDSGRRWILEDLLTTGQLAALAIAALAAALTIYRARICTRS